MSLIGGPGSSGKHSSFCPVHSVRVLGGGNSAGAVADLQAGRTRFQG